MPVIVPRSPLQCSATEVADFVALVQAGGEVIREGLEARVREAKTLFFLLVITGYKVARFTRRDRLKPTQQCNR